MASGLEDGISLSSAPGVPEGSSADPSSLHVGTDALPTFAAVEPEQADLKSEDGFIPPLPPGDGPGQAIILHGDAAIASDDESSAYSTSSDEEEDESQLPPGPIEPGRCTATGQGYTGGPAGRPVKMVITAKDAKGRRIREGGASVVVTLDTTRGVLVASSEVEDHGDGTYTAVYECPSKGPYQLSVTINGEPMGHSPFPIFFSAPGQEPAAATGAAAPAPSTATTGAPAPLPSGPMSAAQIAGIAPSATGQPIQNLGAQAAGAGVPFPAIDLDQLGRTVLVGSGAPFASEEAVRRAVAECGPVVSVRIVGPRRDFCWVEFATAGAAAAAAALDDGGVLRVQPAAAARAGAEALASSLAATDPARALAMQQAQRFAALSAQQAALAESVLAARAMRAGATLPAKNAADVQKNAALAAAAALAKRLAGGAVKEEEGAARRSRELSKDRSRDRSRDRQRRRRSDSRSRSRDRSRRRRSTSQSRSPDRSRRRRSSSRHRSSREARDDDRDRRRRHHKSSSSSKHRQRSSSRDRKSIKKEASPRPAKDELDELFDELEG